MIDTRKMTSGLPEKVIVDCPVCNSAVVFMARDGWRTCENCGGGVRITLKPVEFEICAERYPRGDNDSMSPTAKNPQILKDFLNK